MSDIVYKDLVFNKEQIKNLYLDNQWYAYTNDEDRLFNGILNSSDCIGAYRDNELVGLVRTVSDGETICYIQDILVLRNYHRQGIGKSLMNIIKDKYKHVRQIVLMTENTENTKEFYRNVGMVSYDKIGTIGFIVKKD